MVERRLLRIDGVVQGVGFRPHAHRVATELQLSGLVRNDATGVIIEVEGAPHRVQAFSRHLLRGAPPLAAVGAVESRAIPVRGSDGFVIEESDAGGPRASLVSPDMATCDACRAELDDPADRRFRYPFINCTDCGPRFTIVRSTPYDRVRTTMAGFPMCDECASEYADPAGRRFHAEPVACGRCGPVVRLERSDGIVPGEAAIAEAARLLHRGAVVAIKGLGGYHLACDATAPAAVGRLRARKGREAKPFAVMVRDEAAAEALVVLDAAGRALLTSRERPIAVLPARPDASLAPNVAPGSATVGVMLPYTPLHTLLLDAAGGPLVMTSGNRTDEPIAFRDDEARARLGGIADAFLVHDRPIETRVDDSVLRIVAEQPACVRRARGFAPAPLRLAADCAVQVLAVGGHLKNAFCLTRGRDAFLSHHIGDLDTPGARASLREGIDHYRRLFELEPAVIAHDLHPDYASTRLVDAYPDLDPVAVQHHHAHVASAVAEHRLGDPVLGVVFDGAGLGTDGAIWGGEFLLVHDDRCERLAHLAYVPQPGGDRAAREPWRMAAAHLARAYDGLDGAPVDLLGQPDERLAVLSRMIERGVQAPDTSSVGRLFDAVAALTGVRHSARFEAQAAMELEALAGWAPSAAYPWDTIEGATALALDPAPMIRAIVEDVRRGRGRAAISSAFHHTVATMIVETVRTLSARTGIRAVALTGGVFQNARLTELAAAGLEAIGVSVYLQRAVPCNDGGLALGQAHVARCRMGRN